MTSPLETLEPKHLWTHFDMIRRTPRPSKHEEQIAAAVEGWAKKRGLKVLRDAAGSMTVQVPATPGHENAPTVILQGHLDMVCEKNSDVDHDFMTQGIDVVVDGDWVRAKGTTLGADNGIGVAAAMAMADDADVVHGPLEILCTIDEETGLTGAKMLDPAIVSGMMMINLDTEEDGAIYIGCAGGADTDATLKLSRRRGGLGTVPYRLSVRGLRGGHSGLNIIENRGNAVKMATRTLLAALDAGIDFDLVSVEGGSKHNAIPRECFAIIRMDPAADAKLKEIVVACTRDFREEFSATDPDLELAMAQVDESDGVRDVATVHGRDRLLRLLDGCPTASSPCHATSLAWSRPRRTSRSFTPRTTPHTSSPPIGRRSCPRCSPCDVRFSRSATRPDARSRWTMPTRAGSPTLVRRWCSAPSRSTSRCSATARRSRRSTPDSSAAS